MKRFGRNQKRKLRAQLDHAQDLCTTYERHLVRWQKEGLDLRAKLAGIYDVLLSDFNKYHPLCQFTQTESESIKRDVWVINQYARDGKYYEAILHLLKVSALPDEYKKSISIMVQYADKSAGYYLSDYEVTNRRYTIEELSRKVATALDEHIRSQLTVHHAPHGSRQS